jgi:hypothetical protein
VSEEAYRAVEKAAGIQSPDHHFRAELERCIKGWREKRRLSLATVKPAGFRKAVSNIKADAIRLLSEIDRAKADTQEGRDYEYANMQLGLEETGLGKQLTRLRETAKIWLNPKVTPPGRRGRPSIPSIACLEAAYFKAKGRKASKRNMKPPLGFFRACRDQFDLSLPRTDAALRKAISRHRGRAKCKRDKTSAK